jgi:hypothetical protein
MKNIDQLEVLLEQVEESPLVGGAKRSVIDWDKVRTKYLDVEYFTIKDVTTTIEGMLKSQGLENKVHYSQVLGWLQRMGKKTDSGVKVIKKVLKSGDYAGTYYRLEKKE